MRKSISAIGLAFAVAAGSLAMSTPSSLAQSGLEIQIGPNGVRAREAPRERPVRAGCSERQALAAAREEGLRNAAVVRRTDRSITVEGDTRRGVDTLRFGTSPGCPLI